MCDVRRCRSLLLVLGLALVGAGLLAPVAGALSFGPRADFSTGANPQSVAVADVDGDGHVDIVTAGYDSYDVSVLYGTGTGTFGGRRVFEVCYQPSGLYPADLDLDGRADFAVSHAGWAGAGVLWSDGSAGSLSMLPYATGAAGMDVVVADFNNDGKPDIATANPGAATVSILLGDGKRHFTLKSFNSLIGQPTALTAADFDNDGHQDLFVTGQSDDARVFLGDGTGAFSDAGEIMLDYETNSFSVASDDFNGDGNADVAVAAYGNSVGSNAGEVEVLFGDGAGGFPRGDVGGGRPDYPSATTTLSQPTHTTGVAVADFDGDGRPDLAASNDLVNTVGVVRNTGGDFADLLELPAGAGPSAVATGDFNEDGRQDLVVASAGTNTVGVWLGRFELPSGSITVDGGAAVTGSRTVDVTATVAQAAEMRLRVAGGAWGQWEPYAASTYLTLPAGDGSKTVEAQYRNPVGVSLVVSDTILLDTTAPVTTIPGDLTPGWIQLASVTVGLAADDGAGSGVAGTQYKIGDDGGWVTGASAVVAGTGEIKLWYRSVDKAGNVEEAHCQTFPLDATAPVTVASNVLPGWQRAPFSIIFEPSDTGSGVAETNMAVWHGDVIPIMGFDTFVTITAEGTNRVQYRSVDQAGNYEGWKWVTVYLDRTAPETTDDAPSGWRTTSPQTVTFAAADGEDRSGVKETQSKLDGAGAWTVGGSVEVAGDGVHTLTYRSADRAGNVEGQRSCTVRIDTTAPRTTSVGADDEWHRDAVTVSLFGADAVSGVARTEYTTDGGATWAPGAAVTVTAEGTTTVGYRSADVAGNVEDTKTVAVRIDRTAPVTTDDAPSGWLTGSPATVHLTSGDEGGSGVAKTQYKLDAASAWTDGATVAIAGDGAHTLRYRSIDAAGNVEETQFTTVRVDGAPPTVSISGVDAAWHANSVFAQLLASDAVSGVAFTSFRIDGGDWKDGIGVFVAGEGDHTVTYKAADVAGNIAPEQTAHVRIDLTAPSTSADVPAGWSNAAVTVGLTAEDELSGMSGGSAATQYSLDGGASWRVGTTVTVDPDVAEHSTDAQTVLYRSVDSAGNVETARSCVTRIDTCPPVTFARPVKGRRGAPVKFHVTVTDAIPGSPTATVVIKIRSRAGKLLRTLPAAPVATNAAAVVTWARCRLSPGTYRYEVKAIDAAGNAQSRIGGNTLTVR